MAIEKKKWPQQEHGEPEPFRIIPRSLLCFPVLFGLWPRFAERIQRGVDLRQKALDFVALMRPGVFLQPIQQQLLSRKKLCGGCHQTIR